MSISTRTSRQSMPNPATKTLEFSPGKGVFEEYLSKEEGKKSYDKIKVLVLDRVSQISGWDNVSNVSIYSNQVHNTTSEELRVKNSNDEVLAKGLYKDIKLAIKERGAKFESVFYCLLLNEEATPSLIKVTFKGAGLMGLIDSKIKDGDVLELEKGAEQKKGSVKFYTPKVTKSKPDNEIMELAKKIDAEQLVPYFESLKWNPAQNNSVSKPTEAPTHTAPATENLPEIDIDSINVQMPF